MKAPLNKDIFSESGCISRDVLIRYSRKNIRHSEKHDVEKHLVDCELCSDALEGIALAGGTAVLNEINKRISERTNYLNGNTIRYLAIAASVTSVVILSYLVLLQKDPASTERIAIQQNTFSDSSNNSANFLISEPEVFNSDEKAAAAHTTFPIQTEEVSISSSAEQSDALLQKPSKDTLIVEYHSEAEEKAPVYEQETIALSKNGVVIAADQIEFSSTAAPTSAGYISNIAYVEDLKVIDYATTKGSRVKTPSLTDSHVPSVYQNKNKKQAAEAESKVSSVESKSKSDYVQQLRDPVKNYKRGSYNEAITGFDELLKINPADENATFYKGMSLYHKKEYSRAIELLSQIAMTNTAPFSQEARFYQARCYQETGNKEMAVKIFREIVREGGFYKENARRQLKQMED